MVGNWMLACRLERPVKPGNITFFQPMGLSAHAVDGIVESYSPVECLRTDGR